jgi:hypothetical protein
LKGEKKKTKKPWNPRADRPSVYFIGTNDQPKIIHIFWLQFFFLIQKKKRRVEGMGGMVGGV